MNAVDKCNVTEKSVNKGLNKKKSKNKKNQQQQQQNQAEDEHVNYYPTKESMVVNNDSKSTPPADLPGKSKISNDDNGATTIMNGDTLNAINEKLSNFHIKENGCIENSAIKEKKKSTSSTLEIRNGRASSPISTSAQQQQKSKSQTKKNTTGSANNKSSSSPTSSSSSSSSSQHRSSSPKQFKKVLGSQHQPQQMNKKNEKSDSNLEFGSSNNNNRLTKKHKKSKSKSSSSTVTGVSKDDDLNISNENSTPSNKVSIAPTTPVAVTQAAGTQVMETVLEEQQQESSCRNCKNNVEVNEANFNENQQKYNSNKTNLSLSTSNSVCNSKDICLKKSDDSSHSSVNESDAIKNGNSDEQKGSITNCSGDNESRLDSNVNESSRRSSSNCLDKIGDDVATVGQAGRKIKEEDVVQSPTLTATAQSLPDDASTTIVNNASNIVIEYKEYESELQMQDIMRLIQTELSEPYSIYTYRYFIYNWPKLCFLAAHGSEYVGAIVCKLDMHMNVKRGYIAMLAVKKEYRKLRIGTNLVQKAIEAMLADNADEVVLETEMKNIPALRLYENLGFVRDKRLFRYYLNGVDALRLKLWFR